MFLTGTQQLLNDMGKHYRYSLESPRCVNESTLFNVKLHAGRRSSYCAFVWLLSCVSAHVDHQHVLGLEGLLLPRTLVPATHKLLLLSVDVVIVNMLQTKQGFSTPTVYAS